MEPDHLSQEASDYGSPSPQSISDEGEQLKDSQSADSDNDVRTQNSTNSSSKLSENQSNSYRVPCTNRCGKAIDSNKLVDHIAYDCPLTVVDCSFKHAGCDVRLPRKDIPIHLAHAVVYHLSKQTLAYEERLRLLEAENESLALRCKRLEAKHEELEHHVKWLSHGAFPTVTDLNHYEKMDPDTNSSPHYRSLYYPYLSGSAAFQPESSVLTPTGATNDTSARPATLKMKHFEQYRKNDDDWISQPFYTHLQGYKMCLRVTANGQGSGKGTHITVAVYLMKGEFDDQLEWPFRGDITIQLLNQQEEGEDYTRIIHQAQGERGNASSGERFISAWVISKFKTHSELYPMYVKYDSLKFRILTLVKQSAESSLETAV